MVSIVIQIAAIILAAAASFFTAIMVWQLKQLTAQMKQLDENARSHDARIRIIEQRKAVCNEEFVTKGEWTREAGFNRRQLEQINSSLNQLVGKMSYMEQMPEMAGKIAAQVAKQVMESKNG